MTTICKLCKRVVGVDADEVTEWVVCQGCTQARDIPGREMMTGARNPLGGGYAGEVLGADVVRCPICDESWAVVTEPGQRVQPCPECLRVYTVAQLNGSFRAFDSSGQEVPLPVRRQAS
ncbi:MAG: hypothetical protein Q8P22_02535 [Chloroflexota bacterium]|nr:hypothetical protein [Chloroflexota bacterium]